MSISILGTEAKIVYSVLQRDLRNWRNPKTSLSPPPHFYSKQKHISALLLPLLRTLSVCQTRSETFVLFPVRLFTTDLRFGVMRANAQGSGRRQKKGIWIFSADQIFNFLPAFLCCRMRKYIDTQHRCVCKQCSSDPLLLHHVTMPQIALSTWELRKLHTHCFKGKTKKWIRIFLEEKTELTLSTSTSRLSVWITLGVHDCWTRRAPLFALALSAARHGGWEAL